jgi:two-component system response regulator DevR
MLASQAGRVKIGRKTTQAHIGSQEARRAVRKIKLLIIDDRETVRQALEDRLSQAPEIELVGSVGSTEEGLRAVHAFLPDVVLLEIKMADGSGVDACRRITEAAPLANVIVLTSFMDEAERQAAFQAGASSYVLKDIDSQRLIRAIEAVRRNHVRA